MTLTFIFNELPRDALSYFTVNSCSFRAKCTITVLSPYIAITKISFLYHIMFYIDYINPVLDLFVGHYITSVVLS